ncbi:hypothetical protein AB4851_13430 [Burkholderia sp. 22PA0099]|uniref:hypothetical protein n=1 Tax=unclassified Burkholderia TaxID=2613784 RepID=UPI0039C02DBF
MLRNRIGRASAGAVLAASCMLAASAAQAAGLDIHDARLQDLYARYAQADYEVDDLPEFGDGKHVRFDGVVVEHAEGLDGGNIFVAGDPAKPTEAVARLGAFDDATDAQMKALPVGKRFKAICVLQATSGTHYLALTDCVVKS